ncbi:CwfJ C-terminus 1-domain-containing protein-like protein [Mycotypha africana]|uniref:CwfJ C-terminus 1-domain-containing protein-like protein n=1 Tax=Mycotypha africana TaxID=64632 RepID=UPI002301760C|nr:CwfJ C-terminus 1-domain-containing protein-like protein [Mycotypha africana]KAI8984334.1 CwfJ C-terminus 1-domain-containing protein-like protein [Mycotypha africana]
MTYFNLGDKALPQPLQQRIEEADGEVCDNLYFLGKKVPVTAPPGVDVLITYDWPKQVTDLSSTDLTSIEINEDEKSSVHIAEVAAALKPRYHFAASQKKFYERQPYRNIVSGLAGKEERIASHVTRFIGLSDVLNNEKQRWFYAFNLIPLAKATKDVIEAVPENTTECPFITLLNQHGSNKRKTMMDPESNNGGFFWGEQVADTTKRAKLNSNMPKPGYICRICNTPGHYIQDCPQKTSTPAKHTATPPEGYVCRICHQPGHYIKDCPQKEERPPRPSNEPLDLSTCWFCLSNPKVEKHLIVSIGSEAYVTLAKGPVVPPNHSECTVPGLGHALIIPITHYSRLNQIPPNEKLNVLTEIEKYKTALKQLYDKYDQDIVSFEVSRDTGRNLTHAHIQIVPIPKAKSDQVEVIAREKAVEANMVFEKDVPQNPDIPYFKMDLPNGTSLVYLIKPKERFNLQFGRLVVANVLGAPNREDWKVCSQNDEEEKQCAEAFRKAFQPFDINED